MQKTLNQFKSLFETRYQNVSVLNLGEDSLRYDFFTALTMELNLAPHQIQLEHPIHSGAFNPRNTIGSKRDEKPQIDLWVETEHLKMCIEFGLFKRNKTDNSQGSDTEYGFKILNDFMRLALHSKFTNCDAYFICVADSTMLGTRLSRTNFPAFPASYIEFDHQTLIGTIDKYKSSKKIDDRFLQILLRNQVHVKANLIFDEPINSEINSLETRVLAWKLYSN